ncbi:MAG TPA: hypothetical protein VMJ74_00075 [Pseudomonadales bacterium]|nr:hypothetical protein [Pseudomonadales bacterium]
MPSREAPEPSSARRPIRLFVTLVLAMGVTYYGGREFGLGNDELIGFLLASIGLVVAAGVVGLLVFGVLRLFRRS